MCSSIAWDWGVPSETEHSPARLGRWRQDLAAVLIAALGCFVLSSVFEVFERVTPWLERHESWQLDELPLTLMVLALGLAWFAMRRRRETLVELGLREKAQSEVQHLLQHNRDLAQRLIGVQESERRALARELHDEVGQACTAIRVEAAFIRHCRADARDDVLAAADRTTRQAEHLHGLVRDMLRRLRPANLDALGLVAALQELCESWEERTGVACVFHHEGNAQQLGDDIDIAVYRIAQEALTNVARHAAASAVRMRLSVAEGELLLSVQDDGRGLDPGRAGTGLGLLGATERAAALGGTLQLDALPDKGLKLQLRLPLEGARR